MTPIVLPVSRSRAFLRAILWSVPSLLLAAISIVIYRPLHFIPSGVSNRLVDYSIAVAASPLLLGAVWTAMKSLGLLLQFLWPAKLVIVATQDSLTFCLGPFGCRTYSVADLDVRYSFELSGDDDQGAFESFLPEEQQRRTLLPRILHPGSKQPLQRIVLQYAVGQESDIAEVLRPAIEHWQSARSASSPTKPTPGGAR